MLSTLIQVLLFCCGSVLLIYSGKQDKKTRKPFLLIPALMAIALSANIITFAIVSIACAIIFFLPAKTNKLMGKADLLLFAGILIIFITNINLVLNLILYGALALTIALILLDKKRTDQIPLIHYFSQGYALMILITIASTLGLIIWALV